MEQESIPDNLSFSNRFSFSSQPHRKDQSYRTSSFKAKGPVAQDSVIINGRQLFIDETLQEESSSNSQHRVSRVSFSNKDKVLEK